MQLFDAFRPAVASVTSFGFFPHAQKIEEQHGCGVMIERIIASRGSATRRQRSKLLLSSKQHLHNALVLVGPCQNEPPAFWLSAAVARRQGKSLHSRIGNRPEAGNQALPTSATATVSPGGELG